MIRVCKMYSAPRHEFCLSRVSFSVSRVYFDSQLTLRARCTNTKRYRRVNAKDYTPSFLRDSNWLFYRGPSPIVVAPEADKTNSTGREFTPLLEISRFQCRFVPAFINGVLTQHSFHFLAHPTRRIDRGYHTSRGQVSDVYFIPDRSRECFVL